MSDRRGSCRQATDRIPILPESEFILSEGDVEEEFCGLAGAVPFYCGTRRFGIVDHVPGLFYVATIFYHIYGIPLVPLRSYLFYFGRSVLGGEITVPIWLSAKSVLMAWTRLVLAVLGAVLFITTIGALLSLFINQAGIRFLYGSVPTLVACVVGMKLTRVFEKSSPGRAEKLALKIGFDPDAASQIRTLVEDGVPLDQRADTDVIPCPNCGREIAVTTRVCPRCEYRCSSAQKRL